MVVQLMLLQLYYLLCKNVKVSKNEWKEFSFDITIPASLTINGVAYDSFYIVFRNPNAYNVASNFDLTGGKIKGTQCTFYVDDLRLLQRGDNAVETISTLTAWNSSNWLDHIESLKMQ